MGGSYRVVIPRRLPDARALGHFEDGPSLRREQHDARPQDMLQKPSAVPLNRFERRNIFRGWEN